MSQVIYDSIDPSISGTELAGVLNDFKDAMVSGMSGTSRPSGILPGGGWVDTTGEPDSWTYKIWTGTEDVEVFTVDLVSGVASISLAVDNFVIRRVSADSVGAILELVKRRISSGGQVQSGDVVGEIRMVGRDNSLNNPVVAKIVFEAGENMTSSASGGTLSFHSTPAGSAALVEHMRFIGGLIEVLAPLKKNSEILVGQNVATTASITQLSADKVLVEMTGSTPTEISGINSTGPSKTVTVHNRSSADVTVSHEDGDASASDRIVLPGEQPIVIPPGGTLSFFYSADETRWKLMSGYSLPPTITTREFSGSGQTFVAPGHVSNVRVTTFGGDVNSRGNFIGARPIGIDRYRKAWAWGLNYNGNLGVGNTADRSSPVAVLGGLQFERVSVGGADAAHAHSLGIASSGQLYAWGVNASGALGVGDVTPRSSPVAVLGGRQFREAYTGLLENSYAIDVNGSLYAWGVNTLGALGVGDVTPRSSPVAVLGNLRFSKIINAYDFPGNGILGLTASGAVYGWGSGNRGQLGNGTTTPRSSPVLVVGGYTFKDIVSTNGGTTSSVFGITTGGDLYSWGSNPAGMLGVGDTTARSSPTAVLGGLKFSSMAEGGSEHFIGIDVNGDAYSMGRNDQGQLGVGDTSPRSSPVAVLGGIKWKEIFGGYNMAIGLSRDGDIYAWGGNYEGILGVGDLNNRSSPTLVAGGIKFEKILGVDQGAYALSRDGRIYAWGYNEDGSLGVGDRVGRSSPTAVVGGILFGNPTPQAQMDVPVVGGNSYAVTLGPGLCYLGSTPIGINVSRIVVEYI